MDTKQALEIVRQYVNIVKTKFNLRKALLFGSFAKGTNYIDSDIDVALVFPNVPDIFDLQIELMKLRRDIDLRIEPHPFEEKNFNKYDPLVNEIIQHGIEI